MSGRKPYCRNCGVCISAASTQQCTVGLPLNIAPHFFVPPPSAADVVPQLEQAAMRDSLDLANRLLYKMGRR